MKSKTKLLLWRGLLWNELVSAPVWGWGRGGPPLQPAGQHNSSSWGGKPGGSDTTGWRGGLASKWETAWNTSKRDPWSLKRKLRNILLHGEDWLFWPLPLRKKKSVQDAVTLLIFQGRYFIFFPKDLLQFVNMSKQNISSSAYAVILE